MARGETKGPTLTEESFYKHRRASRQIALLDPEAAESSEPPRQLFLDELWAKVAAVEVLSVFVTPERVLRDKVEFRLQTANELEELAGLLAIEDGGEHDWGSVGDPVFVLLAEDGERLAVLALVNSKYIRRQGWTADAALVFGHALLAWLAVHGVEQPLRTLEKDQDFQLLSTVQHDDWLRATPDAVRDLVASTRSWDCKWTSDIWNHELASILTTRVIDAYPDEVDRTSALLRWFGSGSGLCSGYPCHEAIPEPNLLITPLPTITAALERAPDDTLLWLGAVRLLAGWKFRQTREQELKHLSTRIRERLLEIGIARDEDMTRRSYTAFT